MFSYFLVVAEHSLAAGVIMEQVMEVCCNIVGSEMVSEQFAYDLFACNDIDESEIGSAEYQGSEHS